MYLLHYIYIHTINYLIQPIFRFASIRAKKCIKNFLIISQTKGLSDK
ncbi:hypothetical protein [Citrobacter phage vB_CfrS_K1M]